MAIRLTWTQADPTPALMGRIEYYKVFRAALADPDDTPVFGEIVQLDVDYPADFFPIVHPLTFDDDSVMGGVTYQYYVSAFDSYANELRSNVVEFEVEGAGTLAIRMNNQATSPSFELSAPDFPPNGLTISGWSRAPDEFGNVWTIKAYLNGFRYADVSVYDTGIGLNIASTGGPQTSASPGVEWFFWVIRIFDSGGDTIMSVKWALEGDTDFDPAREVSDVLAPGIGVVNMEVNNTHLGFSEITGNSTFDTDFAQVRQWAAQLTDEELLLEKNSLSAVRTANLTFDLPMQGQDDLADASGHGGDIIASGTAGIEWETTDGPNNV